MYVCTRFKPKLLSQTMENAAQSKGLESLQQGGDRLFRPILDTLEDAKKAVIVQIVTDLTTAVFIGRRGPCSNIYCDKATSFVGASNQLRELYQAILSRELQNQIVNACYLESIEFHFTPPKALHFEGF